MILVDYREKPGKRDKHELVELIRRFGVKAEKADLPFGDFAFEGFDTKGPIAIGVERKRLHDMLNCIDDRRLVTHQRWGITQLYDERWLLIEGIWRSHDPQDMLMEGNNKGEWWPCRPGGRSVLYSKLRRYLFSVARSGSFVDILYTRDMVQTAQDLTHLWHYYQKRDHMSHMCKQRMNIAQLAGRPALVRRWAEEIDGIGPKKAEAAAQLFKTPIALASSEIEEWLCIPNVGVRTAHDIMAQLEGRKR